MGSGPRPGDRLIRLAAADPGWAPGYRGETRWGRLARRRARPGCGRPTESPWLDPIEPTWAHGQEAIAEPGRRLAANEARARVCDDSGREHLEPLAQLPA